MICHSIRDDQENLSEFACAMWNLHITSAPPIAHIPSLTKTSVNQYVSFQFPFYVLYYILPFLYSREDLGITCVFKNLTE